MLEIMQFNSLLEFMQYNVNADWKCLQPEKVDINPSANSAEDDWN